MGLSDFVKGGGWGWRWVLLRTYTLHQHYLLHIIITLLILHVFTY